MLAGEIATEYFAFLAYVPILFYVAGQAVVILPSVGIHRVPKVPGSQIFAEPDDTGCESPDRRTI